MSNVAAAIILLYEVIERAKNSLNQRYGTDARAIASRTLFDIYEEVLREHGIEVEDDGVPLQIINRLARDARRDEGLMQRFKRVMGQIGFEIEHDEDGEGYEFTSVIEGTSTGGQNDPQPTPARRSSLDSLLDGSADKVAGTMDVGRALPLRGRERKSSDTTGQSDIGTWWQKRRTHSDTEVNTLSQAQPRMPQRNDAFSQRPLVPYRHQLPHRRRASSSDGKRFNTARGGNTGTSLFGDSDLDDNDHTGATTDLDPSNVYIPGVNAPIPQDNRPRTRRYEPEPFHLSDTRLLNDAEDLGQQRLHSLLRHCIQKWRERTAEQIARNEQLMRIAIQYDNRIQFRNVKDDLLREAQNRRALRETDDFFGRLEQRAARARNLFLLTKAFTHWARSAEDEVLRTSVARRHILRTRFFNGWREITAVNELKIQHFVLSRFLGRWRRRLGEVQHRQESAVQLYEDNLQRKYYKDWFFKFCEIAAPAWHNARMDPRLKRVTFQQWHEAATVWTERGAWATARRNEQIMQRYTGTWQRKTAAVQALEPRAEAFRRRRLLTNALAAIQRQAQFKPLLSAFQAAASAQRLQSTFQLWHHTGSLSRQSKAVDRMRVLRNAWTAWNDRLRIKALEERINDRVLVENMYKWTLASRVSLFQRVHDHTLKGNIFTTWVTKRNERLQTRYTRRNRLEHAEARFHEFKRDQLLHSCLRKMEGLVAEKRAEEAAVKGQYELKLKQRIFDKLLAKHDHFQQMDRWAGDAQFYVLSTHTLKKWKEATQHARRNRRREAYAQVRRTVKTNLVRRVFGQWKGRADNMMEKLRQAEEIARVRALQNSQAVLARWQFRTASLAANEERALQHCNDRLQLRALSSWRQRLTNLQDMEAQAVNFRQIGVEVSAMTLLKRLSWEGYTYLQRHAAASALHDRHFRQHVGAMIRFWHQQMLSRQSARPVSPSPTSRSRPAPSEPFDDNMQDDEDIHSTGDDFAERPLDDDAGDETRQLEAWTEFDQSALDLSFSISPEPRPQPSVRRNPLPALSLSRRQTPKASTSTSTFRSTPSRPQTFPPSALRSALRPPRIDEESEDEPDATSTPMPLHLRSTGPGYLKTPSKRTLIQHKRAELMGSPEKRVARLGAAASAPPASRMRDVGGEGGLTSFQRRLREGGFGGDEGGRVGYGDVSHFG